MAKQELQPSLQHQQEYEIPAWNQQPTVATDIDLIRAGLDKVLENNGHARVLTGERPLTPEAITSAELNSDANEVKADRELELREALNDARKSSFGLAA